MITLNLRLDANNFVPYWTQLALPPPSKRRFATPIPFIIVYAPQSKSISRGIITINLKAIVRILLFLKHKVTVATYINPILLGGDNFVLHPKFIQITSIWVNLHKNVIRYVLKIYFPDFFEQNQNYQQDT